MKARTPTKNYHILTTRFYKRKRNNSGTRNIYMLFDSSPNNAKNNDWNKNHWYYTIKDVIFPKFGSGT